MNNPPVISVVITSYTTKRLPDIFSLLDSIQTQTYVNIEIIFVAESSPELFVRVQAYAKEKHITIQILFNDKEFGLSAARNIGIQNSKGDIVAFIDDDAVACSEWAQEMVNTYRDDSVIAVTGPAFPLWDNSSMEWFPEEFSWMLGCTTWFTDCHITEVRNVWGMNMSFRREAFEVAGAFSTQFGLHNSNRNSWHDPPSEDNDMSFRVRAKTGKRILYNPKVIIHHRVHQERFSFAFIMQRSYSIGYQRRMLTRLYGHENIYGNILETEHSLVKRILGRLLPSIIMSFFIHPVTSWNRLKVTMIVLVFTCAGYLEGCFRVLPQSTSKL